MARTNGSGECWDRLNEVLVAIKPGDAISVDALVDETGLLRQSARTVLEALTRAELFEQAGDDVYVRRSLFDPPQET